MTRVIRCLPAFLLFFVFVFSAQQAVGQAKGRFSKGSVRNGVYTNPFFNLKMSLPLGWYMASPKELDAMYNTGKDMIAGDDATVKRQLNAADVNTAFLLGMFRYELGAPVPFNHSLLFMVENTKNYPGIRTGSDYIFHLKRAMTQLDMGYTFEASVSQVTLGGRTFDKNVASTTTAMLDAPIQQEYLCHVANGFCLVFILTYADEAQRRQLYEAFDGLRFR